MNVVLTEDPLSLTYIGDVNQDHGVNINDVVAIINQMAGTATWEYADVNGDEKTDINDVVAVINQMANGSNANAYSFNALQHSLEYESADNIENLVVRVKVTRGITSGRQELPLIFSGGSTFSAPSSVIFEDGSDVAYCKVTATRDLQPGETAQFSVSIDTLNVAPDGITATLEDIISHCVLSTIVTVYKDYTWTSLGMGTFTDTEIFSSNPYEAEVQQAIEDPDHFRLVRPYIPGLLAEELPQVEGDPYFCFNLLHPGDQLGSVTVSADSLIYFPNYHTGYIYEDFNAELVAAHPNVLGAYKTNERAWTYNRVIEFQENGLPAYIQLAPVYLLDGTSYMMNRSQNSEVVIFGFPGYRVPVYSVEVEYKEITKDDGGKDYVSAEVTLGEDVDHAWVMVLPNDYGVNTAFDALADGTITAVEIDDDAMYKYHTITAGGTVRVPMPDNVGSGKYIFLVISFDARGQRVADRKDFNYSLFNYENTTETWTPKYIGTYNYDMYFRESKQNLVISQSSLDPTHYRIENWRDGVDFNFTMDADNYLSFDNFSTGYEDETYGEVRLADRGGPVYRVRSYFDGLAFHFMLNYFVDAGTFSYGEETFVITGFPEDAGKDFSIGLDVNYAVGDDFMDVDVTFGADVDHAWVIVVPDSIGASGAYQFITSGKSSSYIPVSASGKVHITMPPSTTETGTYHVVAFTFDASGSEIEDFKSWNYVSMYYKNPNDPEEAWIPRYTGTYSFSQLFSGDVEGYTLYQSDMYPTHYKIENWLTPDISNKIYQNTTFYFTLNADNTISFDTFNIGYNHPTYGEIQAADLHSLKPDSYAAGYFDGSVFHFQIVYFVEAGAFGHGEETFTIDSVLPKQRKPKPLKPSLKTDFSKENLELIPMNIE